MKISRVLVANRGEIAVRIIKACHEMGIETVVTVSDADRESLAAKMADRAVCIGPPRSLDSYLRVDTIVSAALGTGCQAIHPGYGFLCEQPELPEACAEHGIIFIGPTADNIRKLGDKIFARKTAIEVGVPVVPGAELVKTSEEAVVVAEKVGYPILLKAASGGGGKGIAITRSPDNMKVSFEKASAEALSAFGDKRLYMEHYVENARHIEVQILGDHFGHIIHLGERDCSLQRRYQKIVEEAPSIVVSPAMREDITKSALAIAGHLNYRNAGTVEFLLDLDSRRFYFMETNTRIQVEHPVTEMITGVDIVKKQILIAANDPLSLSQSDISLNGHAVECRINAESPNNGFQPRPGRITEWSLPQGEGIRVDTHCYSGYLIPPYYDSLLAKVIAWGKDRSAAIERMKYALANFVIAGIETTIPFHQTLLNHPDFVNGKVNTRWVEDRLISSSVLRTGKI